MAAEAIDGALVWLILTAVWRAAGLPPLRIDTAPALELDPDVGWVDARRAIAASYRRSRTVDPTEVRRERLGTAFALLHVFFVGGVRGQTPGKRALGLAVVDLDGGEAGPGRIAARELVKNPSAMLRPTRGGRLAPWRLLVPLGLAIADWVSLFASRSGRTLRDRLTGTRVVHPRGRRRLVDTPLVRLTD